MIQRVVAFFKDASLRRLFYTFWVAVTALLALVFTCMEQQAAAVTALCFGVGVMVIFACRPSSAVYRFTVENSGWRGIACALLALILTVFVCIQPMDDFALWNGEDPGHRNQYEKLADAFLEGKLYLEYGGEEELAKLENPYDPDERYQAGVWYQWDHAFYDGHYYMYFGVVPVLTTFLPYRVITGEPLTTYRATQWFTLWIAAGLFALFYLLAKRFFPKLPLVVYLVLSSAFSMMSVWFAAAEPALYCTAITAAVSMMVWSLVFFVKAVYATKSENAAIIWAAAGALCGALAFGCRPTVALANLLVIPLLIAFLRQRKFTLKLLGKLALAALPYVVVAVGLMWYNYVRFDSPFEFGQAYQLTVADQTQYGFSFEPKELIRMYNETVKNFFGTADVKAEFPYLNHGGVFFNFPLLLLAVTAFLTPVRKTLRRQKLTPFVVTVAIAMVAITLFQVVWTPYLLERYRMDVYFLGAILCFVPVGVWCTSCEERSRGWRSAVLLVLGVVTALSAALMCVRQIGAYYPDFIEKAENVLLLWK